MISSNRNEYVPDQVSPPGETLMEVLEDRGLTQSDLADRMGRPKKTINEVVKAKASITAETALQLERVLGISASFWNSLEANYRAYLAQERDREILKSQVEWLKLFPISQLVKNGWIEKGNTKIEMVEQLLSFFGVASKDQWNSVYAEPQAAFRRSTNFSMDSAALACWLRMGSIEASSQTCNEYDQGKFRKALQEAKSLTAAPFEESLPKVKELCASAGVSVAFVRRLPRLPISGATMWHSPSRAIIQLSFRYKTDDQFWFTFFHEAGHILLHGKRMVFIEGDAHEGQEEHEANKFAADLLISPNEYRRLAQSKRFSKDSINHFAATIGVSPGIVVGRLQHDGLLPQSHCNDLKKKIDLGALASIVSNHS